MQYDGSINIDSRIDSKGFNAGIKAMMSSLKGLAAAVGVAFGIGAVINFGKRAIDEASAMASALAGLQFMMNAMGRSFSNAKKFINDYVSDGLVPASNAVTAYKNLIARGFDDNQISKMMQAMKDTAVFNRQASFSVGLAIERTTEGLRNENSLLTDSSGITENVSKMWDKYADSIGTAAANLTMAQKRQAEFNGFMEQGKIFAGAAATYVDTYTGKVSALGVSFYNLRVAIGNAIIPIMSKIIDAIKPVIDWLVVLINQFAQFVSVLFGVQIGAAAMGAVADDTQAAADAQGDLADNTAKAGKAAKGALAAFDQLNVLAQDTGTGAGAGGAGAGVGGGIIGDTTATDSALEQIKTKVEAFKQSIMDLIAPASAAFDD